MRRRILTTLLMFALCLSALVGLFTVPAYAQDPTPTVEPTQSDTTAATPSPEAASSATATVLPMTFSETDIITLEQLGETEILLSGPYDSYTIVFGLPADWGLTSGAIVDLFMTVSFNTFAGKSPVGDLGLAFGGTLLVRLNNVTVGMLSLDERGEVHRMISIPDTALTPSRTDGRMELRFTLDSGLTCEINQQMIVVLHPNSRLVFPHEVVEPDTSLANFPRPIYQDSIYPDKALVVIPDKPSVYELQAAMTVAAGLGNLSGSVVQTSLTTDQQLTQVQRAETHLIFVGKAGSLPIMEELDLPIPVSGGQFDVPGGNPEDGVIQQIVSPWNPGRVALVVSGNSDAAVVKAAQALSTGVLRQHSQPNVSLVDQVQVEPVPVSMPVDQTLADLGYPTEKFDRKGINSVSYHFYVPPGQNVSDEAYFDLVYNHSAMLDFNLSGIVVNINGQSIGSVRLTEESSRVARNHNRFDIPPSVLQPGDNRIDVRGTISLFDVCLDPNLDAQWINIWPDSMLHLPLSPVQAETVYSPSLNSYASPFMLDPTLGTTAFVLEKDNLEIWRSAMEIAKYLGDRSNGPVTTLRVFYGDDVLDAERQKYHFMMIGQPSQMPIVQEINELLPAPFEAGSDLAQEKNMQVIYRIPSDSPVGYIQLLASPWSPNHVVYAVLGNTVTGVTGAASILTDSPLRGQLAGNLAVVDGTLVITADTRDKPYVPDSSAGEPAVKPVAPVIDITPPPAERPTWIIPAMLVSAVLVVIILIGALIGGLVNRRSRRALE